MADLVVWGVPEDVVGRLDEQARALGLSRSELVLRQLVEANMPHDADSPHLDARFCGLVRELLDERAS